MRKTRQNAASRNGGEGHRWLVLLHHLPPKPDYLRVKVGRRLRRLGAVALKNSVYVLPDTSHYREGVAEIAREILERGGDAIACEARWVVGLSDAALEDRFREARDAEYAGIAEAARRLVGARGARPAGATRHRADGRELARLRSRFADVVARDPFGAGTRERAAGLLSLAEDRLQGVEAGASPDSRLSAPPHGATWVTRAGVMVDRSACAWLIRRFIDPAARFKFVSAGGYRPQRGEIRFDMAGAEFTHHEQQCTFEVLLERFQPRDSALRSIAEIVHDLDLEDECFKRPETAGVGRMIVGIALNTGDDGERLKHGMALFDGLYQSFRQPSHGLGRRKRFEVARDHTRPERGTPKSARRNTS